MSLKFKKTLLMAMKLNSAHQRLMRITPLSIVNLEMFSKVRNYLLPQRPKYTCVYICMQITFRLFLRTYCVMFLSCAQIRAINKTEYIFIKNN